MVTRWGNDTDEFRELSSKMLTTFLLTMRATPYCYNGDELGMTNIKFDCIEDYRDIETINMYKHLKLHHGDLQQFLEAQKLSARDNARTPFQWNVTAHAGFTNTTPWIKVNPNYKKINAEAQQKDINSCLSYFKKLIKLRKETPALIYGKYTMLDKDNPKVYAYTRVMNEHKILVLLNFSKDAASLNIDIKINNASVLICNYKEGPLGNDSLMLRPYEAVIYQL
jgi:oligo-1,6-glucosidase